MDNDELYDDYNDRGYLGNPNLKRPRQSVHWSEEQKAEWIKCALNPIYFSEKYIQVVHVDHGFIPIKLYDYQKEIVDSISTGRRVAVCTSRQAGKCVKDSTTINIRNKNTGEIQQIAIGDFYEMQKKHSQNENNEEK